MDDKSKIKIDLYKILMIDRNSSKDAIKKAYRKLALKYHPDKNKQLGRNDTSEIFTQIKIAYEVLSNDEQRKKYDNLNDNQLSNFLNLIVIFVKSIINPKNILKIINILCKNDDMLLEEIKKLNSLNNDLTSQQIKSKIEQKLINKINVEYINNIVSNYLINEEKLDDKLDINDNGDISIFIQKEKLKQQNYDLLTNSHKSEYSSVKYYSNAYQTNNIKSSDDNTSDINIFGEIKTTLEEIYNNIKKEITVKRQVIDTSQDENNNYMTTFKNFKYIIPLNEDQIILENQGDQYIVEKKLKTGDLIVDIKCKKHKYFKRVNDYDILVSLPISLYELFYGFNKTFSYFGNTKINLFSSIPFEKIYSNYKIFHYTKFDGNKITISINNLGIQKTDTNDRGLLIIFLVLIKQSKFKNYLESYFN